MNTGRHSRDDVIRTAGRLFAVRGYHGTSMRDLARELGLQGSSLYSHVTSKEALLVDVVRRAANLFEKAARDALAPGGDPTQQLQALIRAHVDVILDHHDEARTFLNEARVLEPEHRRPVLEARDRYEALFRRVLDDGRRSGVFRQDLDTPLAAIFVLSILNSIDRWYDPNGRLDRAALANRLYRYTLDGVASR